MEERTEFKSTGNSVVLTRKRKIGKKQLAIIVTASVLALLIAAYAVINVIISAQSGGTGNNKVDPPEVLEGEAVYNNTAVVYPYIAKSNILSVAVRNHKDSFVMSRPEAEEEGKYENYFMLFYEDDFGELTPYYPNICSEEDVDYTDFYAAATSESAGGYKIDYLCAAIGALYFDNRIEPEADRAAQLNRYGLNAEDRETVYISYIDADGKEQEHRIFIGDSLITGIGFYFMIDDRDYIYTSASSERLAYLLCDFEEFIHSRIVAEGLPSDGLYEPYLTTDYKQWTNAYYGISNGGLGKYVAPGSEVIVHTDVVTPIYLPDGTSNVGDGYRYDGYTTMSIDLQYISKRPEFGRLIKALTSSTVGEYTDNEIVATIVTNINEADIGSTYRYVIRGVEAVLSDDGEYETEGYTVGDNDLIKVIYNYYVDGERKFHEDCHAVIDLSADSVIPDDVRESLRAASIGESLWLDFEVTYTEENVVKRDVQYVIAEIVLITKIAEDGTISYPDTIDADSIVSYKYKYLVDGYEIGKEGSSTVDLSAITDEGDNLTIKNAIIGKGLGKNLDVVALNDAAYCQPFSDFITYRIQTVRGYVEKEMIVSFEFVNSSERDPFYGESIYANTLENENKFYALDATACQNVTYFLGGIGTGSSQLSGGLSGTETVALGLTPANMDKYGLYDGYTVYFELPRGITGVTGTDDYRYLSTLGFYLYISKTQSDGSRYVGSSMYGIIVKIDGAGFDYLEKSFEEYWARRNLVMLDYSVIDKVDVTFGMSEIYGKYELDLDHKTIYIVGNEHHDVKPESGGTEYDFVTVTARPLSETLSDTALKRVLANEQRDSITLANLYNRVAGIGSSGVGLSVGHDTAGTANFKEVLRLLYSTNYTGVMTEEDREAAFESPKIMSLNFTLDNSPYGYTYDFYRVSDRRVMVHLYRVSPSGEVISGSADEVSGFYVSTFAAKKIINAFESLFNGETVDVNTPFWE